MIRKAVILAAGKGTRMREVTNGSSKEMLRINNIPIIEYSISEALEAGCEEILIVISENKKDLRDYIRLRKEQGLPIRTLSREPKGIMDAIYSVKEFSDNEPFALILPDMINIAKKNATLILIETYKKFNKCVIALIIDDDKFGKGYYAGTSIIEKEIYKIFNITTEKNKFRFFGRYVFSPIIFEILKNLPHEESEVSLLRELIKEENLYGALLDGLFFDTGITEGYQKTREYFKGILSSLTNLD